MSSHYVNWNRNMRFCIVAGTWLKFVPVVHHLISYSIAFQRAITRYNQINLKSKNIAPSSHHTLSVNHSQFFKNDFMNDQIYSETFVEIGLWGGGSVIFKV